MQNNNLSSVNIVKYSDISEAVYDCGLDMDDYFKDGAFFEYDRFLLENNGLIVDMDDNSITIEWF